jgi:thioredoxin reductase (NADPH)
MVTSEEIAHVPLFASLTAADRERLSRACADIRLAPGEYAVHEGEDRALFVVLEGRIEVVKLLDGIERVLGERVPGAILPAFSRSGRIAAIATATSAASP